MGSARPPSYRGDSPVHVSPAAFSNISSPGTHNINFNNNSSNNNNNHINNRPRSPHRASGFETRLPSASGPVSAATASAKNANNGQIQLWQFLLELLTDYSCRLVTRLLRQMLCPIVSFIVPFLPSFCASSFWLRTRNCIKRIVGTLVHSSVRP